MHHAAAQSDDPARRAARILLEVGAVGCMTEKPFVFTSGWASPVYTDCRRLISFRGRRALIDMAVDKLQRDAGVECFDAVAGGETAGIPYAAWLSERLQLPMLYVRKQAKGFGRRAQIEGHLNEGDRVLLVEDLATDAASKAGFVGALRDAGAVVEHAFVVFFYGVFPQAEATLRALGIRLHALATWHDVLPEARARRAFPPATMREVEAFLADPVAWSAAHGGVGDTEARSSG
ncbi:MAG: orotate phosphoribosyltransferase [Rhodospirillales bacterium]|nr:orotate phosphoribosyltransferase [Rhodospirillales bacterium]